MEVEGAKKIIVDALGVCETEANTIIEKSILGGEINEDVNLEKWVNERFIPNTVLIDEMGYSQMCIDALKILSKTAPTDFGGSRQRDLAQLWADMTRGYLGEIAFKLFLKNHFNIETELGHEVGSIFKYLPLDIHKIKKSDETWREPRIKIGVKAGKWNGIWLDIPGDQFHHSDVHVFVKTGAGRDHLFAFLKAISVFKDKILKKGVQIGSLTEEESKDLFDNLPSFKPVPAYICGFIKKEGDYNNLDYNGKKGRKHFKITSWRGPLNQNEDLASIKRRERISGKVEFAGIGTFNHDGYLFNIGNLLWKNFDWRQIANLI